MYNNEAVKARVPNGRDGRELHWRRNVSPVPGLKSREKEDEMKRQIDRINRAEVIETNGCPQPILCLFDDRETRIPIATKSWHVDIDGYITHPSTGDYRDDWLSDVVGGCTIAGKKLIGVIKEWLERADLSALIDPDDSDGAAALCKDLMATIAAARGGAK